MGFLVLMILAILAGIGMLLYATQTKERVDCLQDVEICRSTFGIFKTIKEEATVLGIAPKLDCRAVSPPNCEEHELKTTDKQQTMHVIAENLRWCWYKTFGRENTMGKDFAGFGIVMGLIARPVHKDFCLVCSQFTPAVSITPQEWNDFLSTRRVPRTAKTYAEVINPVEDSIWNKKYKDIGFTAGTKQYVVSVSAENSKADVAPHPAYLYIDSDLECGTAYPQIHYQLAPIA